MGPPGRILHERTEDMGNLWADVDFCSLQVTLLQSGETDSTFCESLLRTPALQRVRLEHGERGPSRDSSCCQSLWSRHEALASAGLARNRTAVVQRVERDLKGRFILQMEGSHPVMLTPTGITDSHLKHHLASDHVVPGPPIHHVSLTGKVGGGREALALENLEPRAYVAPLLTSYILGQATYLLRSSVWISEKRDCSGLTPTETGRSRQWSKGDNFPGGPVVKNPPANVGDMGSIPGLGTFHMPRGN